MINRLPNGATIAIRPIRPSDKRLLDEGIRQLSPASAYARFLSNKPHLTSTELRYLTEVDMVDHVAFMAVHADEPGRMAGVARYIRDTNDPTSAEMAVTVCDELHGQGLGTLLGLALADAARAGGIERFTATMLPENRAALALFRRISAHLHSEIHHGVRELVADLPLAA